MKRAEAMLEELVQHVRPPRGCAIVLTEYNSTGSTDPNWVAASGNMELQSSSVTVRKSPDGAGQTHKSTGQALRFLPVNVAWPFGFQR